MARQYAVDDSEWYEVRFINGYALFMGYLMMGVRGLGLLVITWTTVVLLGGFVSNLEKNDFWCLTGITLIQVAGVFNFLLSEKLGDMVHLWWGLLGAAVGTVIKEKRKGNAEEDEDISTKRILLAFAVSAIQGVVLFVVLCPVAILYVFGLGISSGASFWRLIKHDFGNDGGANKKPALQVLYCLAVAQGVLFGYKMIHAFAAKGGLVKFGYNQLEKRVPKKLVAEYLEDTVAGCEKDPSFATGRNLVTYGVDLMMEAKSSESFIAGIKVLGGAIGCAESGRKVLAKYLLTRSDDSSTSIVQRLLETVGPRSPYSREIKEHVVRILDIIGPCIRLEQFPRAIECLCSVVDTSEDSQRWGGDYGSYIWMNDHIWESTGYDNRYKDYERADLLETYEKYYIKYEHRIGSPDLGSIVLKKLFQCLPCKRIEVKFDEGEENTRRGLDQLLIRATDMIYKLVTREDNIWILRTCVSNTVLHKIATLPLKLHKDYNHDPCHLVEIRRLKPELQMLEKCWVLTERLFIDLRQRRREENNQEIEEVEEDGNTMLLLRRSIQRTIKRIFECFDCSATQKRQAIQILLHLSLDMSLFIEDSESGRRRLSWILLLIFCSTVDDSKCWMVPSLTYPNNNRCDFNDIRRMAGEKLSEMLREKHKLPPEETATEIELVGLALRDLKSAFEADSEDISTRIHAIKIMKDLCVDYTSYSEVVKEFLVRAIPEVVRETLIHCESKTAERQDETTDEEKGNVLQDNQDGCIDNQRLRKALASLCVFGYMAERIELIDGIHAACINLPPYLNSKFREIATETCEEQGKSFGDFKQLILQSSEWELRRSRPSVNLPWTPSET